MQESLRQVGPRLRAARRQQGLTLEELAAQAGLSPSTLSRLESGKRQANLELLVPLTRELKMTIDELIPSEIPDPRVALTPTRRGSMIIVPLTPSHAPVHTYKITYLPVDGMPEVRVHPGYEWFYVLHGRLRLRLDEREFVLGKGEAAEFDTRTPHCVAAANSRPAEVISIFDEAGNGFSTRALGREAAPH